MRRGLSLLEVVLAIAILATAYVPLAELWSFTTDAAIQSRAHLLALQLSRNLFEVFESRTDTVLAALDDRGISADVLANAEVRSALTGGAPQTEELLKSGRFRMPVTVTRRVGSLRGLMRIEMTIQWEEEGHVRQLRHARLFDL